MHRSQWSAAKISMLYVGIAPQNVFVYEAWQNGAVSTLYYRRFWLRNVSALLAWCTAY